MINQTLAEWLAELSSDAIGLCLFGPAYYFAFVNFIVSFQYLDVTGITHPAPRIRLRVMREMIRTSELGYYDKLGTLKEPFDRWAPLLDQDTDPKDPTLKVVLAALTPIIPTIISDAIEAVRRRGLLFSADALETSNSLAEMLLHLIPPIETLDSDGSRFLPTDVRTMLNAGWRVQLTSLSEFAAVNHIDIKQQGTMLEAKERLSEMLLKSLELFETRTTWEEVRNDAALGS